MRAPIEEEPCTRILVGGLNRTPNVISPTRARPTVFYDMYVGWYGRSSVMHVNMPETTRVKDIAKIPRVQKFMHTDNVDYWTQSDIIVPEMALIKDLGSSAAVLAHVRGRGGARDDDFKDTFHDGIIRGTHKSLYDYKQALGRQCRLDYGSYGTDLLLGELAPIDHTSLPDERVASIFDELRLYTLLTAPKEAKVAANGVPNNTARQFVYLQLRKRMTETNIRIVNTCFGEARAEVQNVQPKPLHERLKAIWNALDTRFGDVPEQKLLDSKLLLD